MTRRISVRPAASVDTDQHVAYLSENNPQAAMRFFDAARQTFVALARMPGIGRLYRTGKNETEDIRRWAVKGFKDYLIFILLR
jgi:toxin ParE1/3/4